MPQVTKMTRQNTTVSNTSKPTSKFLKKFSIKEIEKHKGKYDDFGFYHLKDGSFWGPGTPEPDIIRNGMAVDRDFSLKGFDPKGKRRLRLPLVQLC